MDGLGDLHRQLARRHEHDAGHLAGLAARGPLAAIRCSIGSANAAVLPVPVAGLAEDVAPLEQERNRFALDGRGLFVAEGGEGGDELGAEAELVERWTGDSVFRIFSCGRPLTAGRGPPLARAAAIARR